MEADIKIREHEEHEGLVAQTERVKVEWFVAFNAVNVSVTSIYANGGEREVFASELPLSVLAQRVRDGNEQALYQLTANVYEQSVSSLDSEQRTQLDLIFGVILATNPPVNVLEDDGNAA